MAIYISGVKGLPEQVQENKENIKTIQEEIEGIDFDEIRELEEQVGENTQDINNLEGSVGVQNIAIADHEDRLDTLEPKVSALENKTQEITYDDVNNTTNMQGVKAQDIEAHTLSITADNYGITSNEVVSKDNKGAIVLATASNPTTSLFNTASGTNHSFNLNDDGSVDVDGNPIGKSFYMHTFNTALSGQAVAYWGFIITSDPTPFTAPTLASYLYNKGIIDGGDSSPVRILKLTNNASDTSYTFGLYSADGLTLQHKREGGAPAVVASVYDNVYEL